MTATDDEIWALYRKSRNWLMGERMKEMPVEAIIKDMKALMGKLEDCRDVNRILKVALGELLLVAQDGCFADDPKLVRARDNARLAMKKAEGK